MLFSNSVVSQIGLFTSRGGGTASKEVKGGGSVGGTRPGRSMPTAARSAKQAAQSVNEPQRAAAQ